MSYYVSYITEYPIYEPAEGGYYYAGTQIQLCREFSTWKKANRFFQKLRKEFLEEFSYDSERVVDGVCSGVSKWRNPFVAYCSKYIGDGERIELTKKKPVERGYEPYC